MLALRRLNMDSSWQISWAGTSFLLDPWLIGSEVDGFSWFNEQWHAISPLKIEDLSSYHAVLVSQPYSDHCHEASIQLLENVPFLATPKAAKRLQKTFPKRPMHLLPTLHSNTWLEFGHLAFSYLKSTKKLSAAFDGIVIKHQSETLVYCPHGFDLGAQELSILQALKTKALLTGFSSFDLPFFLGGTVNPGKNKALKLIQQLQPEKVFHTHDEDKPSKGLVKKIAQYHYPKQDQLEAELGASFVYLDEQYLSYSF